MSSILVVVYSYTGTSRRLAQMLCAQQGWLSGEVVEHSPRSGWSGTLRCVLDSLLRRRPPVRYDGPDPAGFDTVVLVAPIWLYRLAGPMRSFAAAYAARLERVAVIFTMGSAGAVNAVAEIGTLLRHAPVLSAAFTAREVEDASCAERLRAFSETLQPGSTHETGQRPATWSPKAV